MVANKPGNLDGETAVSVWTPPASDAIVTTARPRTDDAPTAERSAERFTSPEEWLDPLASSFPSPNFFVSEE